MNKDRGGYWVLAQVLLLALHFALPFFWKGPYSWGKFLEPPMAWIAFPFALLGAFFTLGGFFKLGSNLTAFPRPLESGELVDRGVYAFVRHPIYSGLICLCLAWALLWNSALPFLSCAGVFVFFERKASREERWLVEKYPGYGAYRRRVRKLVAFLY
ncbi:MAG: isoprenylcysteine carboxylmethyltransferase family protein [Spirochaetes bacterium]|nr:isoprenylcysteine carboxylmethyltransferase family protein [Spirochaetota bacterium]